MSTPNDGGPAFPCSIPTGRYTEHADVDNRSVSIVPEYVQQTGLTLRDWFATHATERDIDETRSCMDAPPYTPYTRAERRYMWADAMLAARGKQP